MCFFTLSFHSEMKNQHDRTWLNLKTWRNPSGEESKAESREWTQDAQRAGHTLQHCCHTIVKIIISQFTMFTLVFIWFRLLSFGIHVGISSFSLLQFHIWCEKLIYWVEFEHNRSIHELSRQHLIFFKVLYVLPLSNTKQ